ncbi:MAG: DUF2283 domain-containing protein [Candidatus Delongbacteria bacterium]|nr:DUF2283 domain-containing protein [Candidatus Delongbacteria bacterium]
MDALKIIEKKEGLVWKFDAEADVLYISSGDPKFAVSLDIGEGTVLRFDPETNDVLGITILNVSKRALRELKTHVAEETAPYGKN